MPSLKGEGIGTGQPGEPLRGVGSEGQDAFVGIDHLIAAIDGKRNQGKGGGGGGGGGGGIRGGRKGHNGGSRSAGCWGSKQGRWTCGGELEKGQRKARDLLLQGEDLLLHLSQLGVYLGRRQ